MRVLWLFRLRSRSDVIAERPSLSLAPLFPKDDGSLLTTVPRVLICEGGRGDVRIRPSLALFKKVRSDAYVMGSLRVYVSFVRPHGVGKKRN